MSLYVDTSALMKGYIDEVDSDDCESILRTDPQWITAQHTFVEGQSVLGRLLEGYDLADALDLFVANWNAIVVVDLDHETCRRAAEFAVTLEVRALDALHLAAAHRAGAPGVPFVTYDLRLAMAARSLGWTVLGV